MSKKYVPSGYQIINLDLTEKTQGTPFTPETEDEKLLHEILSSNGLPKPILLHIVSSNYKLVGFAVCESGYSICLQDKSVTEEIIIADDKLTWTETEL